MPRPYASGIVGADAGEVWRLVRNFDGLPEWHPAIATSRLESGTADGVGAVRVLELADGGTVRERLVALDDAARTYTYDILDSPFAVRFYRSTIRVTPVTASGETFVDWWCEYDADAAHEAELDETFRAGVYAAGIDGLGAYFRGR